jgi:S1-C subfamily serine protease
MVDNGSKACKVSIWLSRSEKEAPSIGYRAVVVISNGLLDLAILRVLDEFGSPVVIAEASPLRFATEVPTLGQEITVLGYPGLGGSLITLSSGRYAGLSDDSPPYYKTDAMINAGNSGGGAFDSRGELVGVASAVSYDDTDSAATPLGLLRPIADAIPLLEQARTASYSVLESQNFDYTSDDNSNLDPRFVSCREAKSNGYGPYISGLHEEYDWYLDRDADGVVCE